LRLLKLENKINNKPLELSGGDSNALRWRARSLTIRR
jgi:hypothetical protein